jgi:hypothetical protein
LRIRANDPKDVLRLEIETALAEGKPIIPVLIERTDMPGYGQLPNWAAPLPDFNAARVSKTNDFKPHMERLGTQLAEGFGFKRIVVAGISTPPRAATARAISPIVALSIAAFLLIAASLTLYPSLFSPLIGSWSAITTSDPSNPRSTEPRSKTTITGDCNITGTNISGNVNVECSR